jgi:hypothetical protein
MCLLVLVASCSIPTKLSINEHWEAQSSVDKMSREMSQHACCLLIYHSHISFSSLPAKCVMIEQRTLLGATSFPYKYKVFVSTLSMLDLILNMWSSSG